jgi:hypothetical protein
MMPYKITVAIFSFFACSILLGSMSHADVTADVYDYGIYEHYRSGDPENPGLRLLEKTNAVPLRKGTIFGFRWVLKGLKPGEKEEVTYRIKHPSLTNPLGFKSQGADDRSFFIARQAEQKITSIYILSEDYELVSGSWTISQIYRGRTLAEITFKVAAGVNADYKNKVAPSGYVVQQLESFNGDILRPKDWFYNSHPAAAGYHWIISKEDPYLEPYKTGLSIQLFMKMKEKRGMTPKDFVYKTIAEKKKAADQALKECDEKAQGSYMRRCLETEEYLTVNNQRIKFHILYSFLWSAKSDTAVIMTFGAPAREWDSVREIWDKMSVFTLADVNL